LFRPRSTNIDNNKFKAFSKAGYGFGAFWKKTEIFAGGSNLVQSIEESAELPTITLSNRFSDVWIMWYGTLPGTKLSDQQFYPPAHYAWYINLENCSISERYKYVPDTWKGGFDLID
jgi:hypothetical protein